MMGTTHIRGYRYTYPQSRPLRSSVGMDWLRFFVLTARQRAALLVLAACAGCIGVVSALGLHAGAMSAQQDLQEIRRTHVALDGEHVQLLAMRAQLSSRERIVKMAGARLGLSEPGADQVQRM